MLSQDDDHAGMGGPSIQQRRTKTQLTIMDAQQAKAGRRGQAKLPSRIEGKLAVAVRM
jgi:hypothetical protein